MKTSEYVVAPEEACSIGKETSETSLENSNSLLGWRKFPLVPEDFSPTKCTEMIRLKSDKIKLMSVIKIKIRLIKTLRSDMSTFTIFLTTDPLPKQNPLL